MARCTAPVQGHRTASGRDSCPACSSGSYGRSYYSRPSYSPPAYSRPVSALTNRSSGGGSSSGGRPGRSGGRSSLSYTVAERRTLEPVGRAVERQLQASPPQVYPARRDLFLCHAWDDRRSSAKELHDLLEALDVSVWFSEKDVGLGTSLLRQIDKGLMNSSAAIVLVTPALLASLEAEGIADKELSVLLATDRVIPVAHGTTFDALRNVSPLLAARSGLTTGESSLQDVAAKVAETVRADTAHE